MWGWRCEPDEDGHWDDDYVIDACPLCLGEGIVREEWFSGVDSSNGDILGHTTEWVCDECWGTGGALFPAQSIDIDDIAEDLPLDAYKDILSR